MKKLRFLSLSFLVIILLNSCGSNNGGKISADGKLSGTVSISGAFALYPITVKWAEEFQKLNPDVTIDISAGGAGKGMTDALSGMVDLGMFSRGISDEEKAKGVWWIAVTKDAVLPTVNAKNPFIAQLLEKGLTRQQFIDIFITGKIKTWGECLGTNNTQKINVFTRSDACGAAEMWGKYLGKNQEGIQGTGVFGDPGIADVVKKDIYSVGYNNVIFVYDFKSRKKYEGMEIIPIDLDANGKIDDNERFYATIDDIMKAIQENKFPSPPARDLYLVSKGKPQNVACAAFIKWILTDGQKFVKEAGYVELTKEKIDLELEKLK